MRTSSKTCLLFSAFLILLVIIPGEIRPAAATTGELLTVSFIDVGQGDAILLQAPGDFDVLVDGGERSAGESVLAHLRDVGVADLEFIIASHSDSDHIGGLIPVLEADDIPVENVLYNGYPGETYTWDDFLSAVTMEGLTLTAASYPQTYAWGAVSVSIFNPEAGFSYPNMDNASLVIRVDYLDFEMLLTGDIYSETDADLLAKGVPLAADVLKVAHHGSRYSSSSDFLAAVHPLEAVISVGDNPYGHPAFETLDRLSDAGAQVWRTDCHGTVVISTDGFTYQVTIDQRLYLPLVLR